jgi:lambda family phage portal protein
VSKPTLTTFDRLTLAIAPRWTLQRVRARVAAAQLARHFEAAQPGRRTSGWTRNRGDANAVAGVALAELRLHARDLIRNNGWARRAQRVIANNTAGWGIVPRPKGPSAARAKELWDAWADSPQCESGGRLTFYAIQALAMRCIPEAGEILIRRRLRRPEDGLPVPLQLQVLEPDHLDTAKDLPTSAAGGPIIQGVEFDLIGRRAAYWIFPEHPGGSRSTGVSQRIPATEILHVYFPDRANQVRGLSWFGAAIVPLKDLDEYEDAELLRQKIAACFAAFVTDVDGAGGALGEQDPDDELIETFEPGMILQLPPGKQVTTANPPTVVESSFTTRNLRRIAAALGVTYEDLTGDYSQVNYSSARMGRLAHWANVYDWQYNMLIPQLCMGVWQWFVEAAALSGALPDGGTADWTTPPMPMLDPGQEGKAYRDLIRSGIRTFSEVIREQGGDPVQHMDEIAEDNKMADERGIKLDSDPRRMSAAGLTQERVGLAGKASKKDEADPEAEDPDA